MPIAVAGDSTQFTAYFQNLISEYHNRYGGRGVMIYWHVEKMLVVSTLNSKVFLTLKYLQ